MLFPQFCQKPSEQGSRALEATGFDLIVELHTVSASVLPALQNVALVGVKQTPSGSSCGLVFLGILLCLDKCAHGLARQVQFACNRSQTEPLRKQRAHVLIAGHTLVASDLFLKGLVTHPKWSLIGKGRNSAVVFLGFRFPLWFYALVEALVFAA